MIHTHGAAKAASSVLCDTLIFSLGVRDPPSETIAVSSPGFRCFVSYQIDSKYIRLHPHVTGRLDVHLLVHAEIFISDCLPRWLTYVCGFSIRSDVKESSIVNGAIAGPCT